MDKRRLLRLAGRQFGLFTRAQARTCGYSTFQIRRRVAEGEWQVVLGGALAAAGLRITTSMRDYAAALAVPGAVLAGPSAARTYGMRLPDEGQYLYLGTHHTSRVTGIRFLHSMPAPRDIGIYHGLPVTLAAATVVDCLRLLPMAAAESFADRVLQQGWITIGDLVARTRAHLGRPGAPQLVTLVRRMSGGERAKSERHLTAILTRGAVTGWRANAPVHDNNDRLIGIADVLFERERLIVEVDGWAYHVTPDRFQGDRRRQNRLIAAGWRVLRFTWSDVTTRPAEVLRTIQSVIGAARTNG